MTDNLEQAKLREEIYQALYDYDEDEHLQIDELADEISRRIFEKRRECTLAEFEKNKLIRAQQPCGNGVGNLKPYWMGNGQFSECTCILNYGHDGECKCSHLLEDK